MATCVCRHGCATVVHDAGDLCDPCWKAGCVRASELISRAPAYPADQTSPDDIRAERDQTRSDLAAERVASAEAARALEVARKALEEIERECQMNRTLSDEWRVVVKLIVLPVATNGLAALRSMAGEKEGAA